MALSKEWDSDVCQIPAPNPLAIPFPPLLWSASNREVQGEGGDGGADQEVGRGDGVTCNHH